MQILRGVSSVFIPFDVSNKGCQLLELENINHFVLKCNFIPLPSCFSAVAHALELFDSLQKNLLIFCFNANVNNLKLEMELTLLLYFFVIQLNYINNQ